MPQRLVKQEVQPRALKMSDVKMTDMELTDQMTGHEIAGLENAGHEMAGHKSLILIPYLLNYSPHSLSLSWMKI